MVHRDNVMGKTVFLPVSCDNQVQQVQLFVLATRLAKTIGLNTGFLSLLYLTFLTFVDKRKFIKTFKQFGNLKFTLKWPKPAKPPSPRGVGMSPETLPLDSGFLKFLFPSKTQDRNFHRSQYFSFHSQKTRREICSYNLIPVRRKWNTTVAKCCRSRAVFLEQTAL